jgi:DMSO/TMAO reductase YedYZ molybdopterin-dependent catalytic subunit
MSNPSGKISNNNTDPAGKRIRRRTILSFIVFSVFIVACYIGWRILYDQAADSGIQHGIRTGLNADDSFFDKIFSRHHLAKSYPTTEAVKNVRVNGGIGMGKDFDPALWRLKVVRKPGDTLFLTLDDIRALPKTDVVFDFKCIEGWSQVTYWSGVRFSDFVKKYNLTGQSGMKYTGLITPDEKYYVGIDMASMMQPQTLLCYEMNGRPLPMNQGYPLRLIIPVKYGIKHLKRIGTMYFQDDKPKDYWAEKGYDYYSGL